jgi:phage shock protein A
LKVKSIKIAGKKFKLASRMARLYALFIDFTCLSVVQVISACLMGLIMRDPPEGTWQGFAVGTFVFFCIALWTFGLLFIDGFRKGQGIGKKLLSLQVLRLKDGKPCSFKDAFIRRFAGAFLPLDFLWALGGKRQRLGDKFAETVVVKLESELEQIETDPKDPEAVLESAIDAMKNKLSEARQKVDASIGVEKQFQNAYEGAVTQADRWQERAVINLKVGREDLAREDIEKRNEYRRLADQYKTQWDEQKQVVRALNDLLEHLQQKMIEAEGKKTVIVAQHRNVDAEEGAVAQAERWQERAIISLKAEREDLAREDLEKRNEYRRLADQHKKQWEEQKQIVRSLSNLLEHFQQKIMEAEGKKAAVMAQHRNVNAEAHLREMLEEIQDNKAFETLVKMEQDATEASTLAKAAAEVDVAYQDTKLAREFASYAEEASLAHLREMLKEIQDSKAFETLAKMEQDATEASTLAKAAAEVDVAYQDTKLEREFSSYAEEASIDKDIAELKTKLQ